MDHLRDNRPKTYHAEVSESPSASFRRSGDPDRDMIREMMLALRTASKFSRDISNEDLEKLCREAFYQGKHRDLKWLEQQMRTMAPPPAPVIRQPRNDSEGMVATEVQVTGAAAATTAAGESFTEKAAAQSVGASSNRLTGATASAVSNRKGGTDDSHQIKDKKRQEEREEDEFEDDSLDDDDMDDDDLDDDDVFSDEDDLEIDDTEDSDTETSSTGKPSSNRQPSDRKNKSSDGGYLHRSHSLEISAQTSVEASSDLNQKEIKDHLATVFPTPVSHISSREDLDPVILRHRQWKDSVLSARLELSSGRANLCNEDLSGFDLAGVDLSCAIFRGAKLCGTNFKGANLAGADFSSADLQGADLRNANLRRCKFLRADLREAEIEGAQIEGADFNWAKRPASLEDPKKQNNMAHSSDVPADQMLSSESHADKALMQNSEDPKVTSEVTAAEESSFSAE